MKEFSNEQALKIFQELTGEIEKENFIDVYFWKQAVGRDLIIDYSLLLDREQLILQIFEFCLLHNDLKIAYEMAMLCIAIYTLKTEKATNLIEKYNKILNKTPEYKEEFRIGY